MFSEKKMLLQKIKWWGAPHISLRCCRYIYIYIIYNIINIYIYIYIYVNLYQYISIYVNNDNNTSALVIPIRRISFVREIKIKNNN